MMLLFVAFLNPVFFTLNPLQNISILTIHNFYNAILIILGEPLFLKLINNVLDACKQKYCITENIEDKTVILVDDSIVRGNTLKHLISLVKSYNPKQIHFVVASPPIKYTCSYGVDFADIEELIANKMSVKEMVQYFGFDS